MDGEIHQQRAQYVGIINGIVYRIDSSPGRSGDAVELVPLDVEAAAFNGRIAASQPKGMPRAKPMALAAAGDAGMADTVNSLAASEAATGQASDPEQARHVRLFPRDGAEPLRAGHPDLWQLLVAGTCLEGSTFRSGWSDDPTPADPGGVSARATKPGVP